MEAFSRRALLVRGGVLAGALLAGPVGRAAARVPAAGLTPSRQRTYAALVRAAGAVPGSGVDSGRVEWATQRFVGGYQDRLPDNRRRVDDLLDALEFSPGGRRFSSLRASEGIGHLRTLAGARSAERDLSSQALGLAAAPFAPTIDGDELPPVPVAV